MRQLPFADCARPYGSKAVTLEITPEITCA